MSHAVLCPSCQVPLEFQQTTELAACPRCASQLKLDLFPALLRQLSGRAGESLMDSSEASCFYHEEKRAEVACDQCGRFLCGLCDIDLGTKHICPGCLESDRQSEKVETFQSSAVLYDQIAGSAAILPLFFFPITLVTAPYVLYLCVRYRNFGAALPRPRSAWRFAAPGALAILQLLGWLVFAIMLAAEGIS